MSNRFLENLRPEEAKVPPSTELAAEAYRQAYERMKLAKHLQDDLDEDDQIALRDVAIKYCLTLEAIDKIEKQVDGTLSINPGSI